MTQSLPLINEVVDSDLCIACGACLPACPYQNIRSVFNLNRGSHEVEIISTKQCIGCIQPCDNVCPSIEVDFLKIKNVLYQGGADDKQPDREEWLKSTHLAWSPDYRDDGISSSGGVLRTFISHALKNNTPVVCLALDPQDNQFKPRLLTDVHEMAYIPGSIYHSTSFMGAIDLIRQAIRPILLVAIPCQLSGILQYIANHEKDLASQIKLICGLVCGWMYSYHSLKAFSKFKNISNPIFDLTTYRGGDEVGQLTISTKNQRHDFERRKYKTLNDAIDYQSSFSTDFNRLRCRVCEDHLNLSADIIVGDAWLKRKEGQKVSIIGCRTERGEQALATIEQLGLLKMETSSFDDLIESQSANLVFGSHARKMNKILKEKGQVTPSFLFRDHNAFVKVTLKDKYSVSIELIRRRLVRGGYYSIYRLLYIIRRLRVYIRFIGVKIKRKILKS